MTRNSSILRFIFFVLITLNSISLTGQKQILVKQLDVDKLPKEIKYEGEIKTAVSWVDQQGENIVLLTETGIYESQKITHENNGGDAELFAYHYIVKENAAIQTWKIYDFIFDCPVDIEAKFIKNTFQITDLNKDGIGEVWMMYKTVCHGDMSPLNLKIIMYQGKQKFALRGQSKILLEIDKKGIKHYDGGEYKFDMSFAEGPKEFLDFAKKMWHKNVVQELGEQ